MGVLNLEAWWRTLPLESKKVAFRLMKNTSEKEARRCIECDKDTVFQEDLDIIKNSI